MKAETQFTFHGVTYSVGNINGVDQFHLFRRLAPMVATMGVQMFQLLSGKQAAEGMSKTDWMLLAAPLVGEMAKMPQEDVDYIIQNSLKVVRRRDGDAWAPLLNAQGQLMFQNLGMVAMLRIILEVLRHNLDDFFVEPQDEESS